MKKTNLRLLWVLPISLLILLSGYYSIFYSGLDKLFFAMMEANWAGQLLGGFSMGTPAMTAFGFYLSFKGKEVKKREARA